MPVTAPFISSAMPTVYLYLLKWGPSSGCSPSPFTKKTFKPTPSVLANLLGTPRHPACPLLKARTLYQRPVACSHPSEGQKCCLQVVAPLVRPQLPYGRPQSVQTQCLPRMVRWACRSVGSLLHLTTQTVLAGLTQCWFLAGVGHNYCGRVSRGMPC